MVLAKKLLNYCNFSTFHQSTTENGLWFSHLTTFNPRKKIGPRFSFPSLTHTSAAFLPSLPPTIVCLLPAAGRNHTGQEGIMPLFLLRSAIVRRLWLDTRLLLASFLRRSSTVSRVCPRPFGLPNTLPGRSGWKLEEKDEGKSTEVWMKSSGEPFYLIYS